MDAYKEKIKLFSYTNVHLSAPSKYLIDKVVSTGIIDAQRTHVIRNIYQPEEPVFIDKQAVKSHILLIADSLLERRKGMSLALEALSLATAKFDGDLIVHLVGYADDQLKKLCSEYKINAVFYGRITEHSKLVKLYQNVGVLLTCSYEDNWPNILVEAGAYGVVPVVGSSHGCEEFCKSFNVGHIVNEYTPKMFADCIVNSIDRYPSNEVLNDYSISVRQAHSVVEVIKTYEAVISEISSTKNMLRILDKHIKTSCVFSENYKILNSAIGGLVIEPVKNGPFSAISLPHTKYGVMINVKLSVDGDQI
jgi:glycosyltransferase involved in cell wall biosynthesis